MRELIFTAFTGKDNASIDIGLCLWCLSTIAFLCFMGFALIVRGDHFDPVTWACGLGSLTMMHAAGQTIKSKTEPGG